MLWKVATLTAAKHLTSSVTWCMRRLKNDTNNWMSSKILQEIQMTLDIEKTWVHHWTPCFWSPLSAFHQSKALSLVSLLLLTFLKHVSVVMYILLRFPHNWWLELLPEQLFVPSCSSGATVTHYSTNCKKMQVTGYFLLQSIRILDTKRVKCFFFVLFFF